MVFSILYSRLSCLFIVYLIFYISLFVFDVILFADGTNFTVFLSHKKTQSAFFDRLTDWFKKSSFVAFKPRQKRNAPDISVCLNNCQIKCTKEAFFLGVL